MKENLIKIDNEDDFRKDPESGAVINVNRSKIQREREVAAARRKNKNKFNELKSEVKELKQMLSQIVEKLQ